MLQYTSAYLKLQSNILGLWNTLPRSTISTISKHGILRKRTHRGVNSGLKHVIFRRHPTNIPVLITPRQSSKTNNSVNSATPFRQVYKPLGVNTTNLTRIELPKWQLPSVLNLNARSLLPKVDELETIAFMNSIDIIGVSETWCNKDMPNSVCYLLGVTTLNATTGVTALVVAFAVILKSIYHTIAGSN